jgi:hypothetical protein
MPGTSASHVQAFFLGHVKKRGDVIDASVVPRALDKLKHIPEHVGENRVQSHCSHLSQSIAPILGWYTLRINLTPNDLVGLAMEEEVSVVVREGWRDG